MTNDEIELAVGPDFHSVWFTRIPGTMTIICALTLTDGSTLIGKSARVNPEVFNAELGQKFAAKDAIRQAGVFIRWRTVDARAIAFP